MLFPGSRIWYEGAAADLASLTDEIKSSGFSGHIVLEFQESIDIVVCVGGEFVKVIEKIGRRILSTKKYREIWGKCQIKQGRMTVFKLPHGLARRLRATGARRTLCAGTAAAECDPARVISGLKTASFSGFLDATSPAGTLLLEFASGKIVGCHYTEYEGPAYGGLEAFRAWHAAYVAAEAPSCFSVADASPGLEGGLWDEILMANVELVPLPLRTSLQRLQRRFGRSAAAGEVLFDAGSRPGRALYLLSGEVALRPAGSAENAIFRRLAPGDLIGLDWLDPNAAARVTGRALSASSYLAFGREDLELVFANSPLLAALCVRESATALLTVRSRLSAYRAEPRLCDVDAAVAQVLGRPRPDGHLGVPAAELFRELTQTLPLSLPEIDALFRRLAALGGIGQSGGRITLQPRES